MSTNIFLHKYSVHVPSIARARVLPTFILRRPMIYLDYHNGRDMEIVYPFGKWDEAKKDFTNLQSEIRKCQTALANVEKNMSIYQPHLEAKSSDLENDMK